MTHRSIAGKVQGDSDGSLTELVVTRLTGAMENDGDADPRAVVDEAIALAEAFPLKWTPEQEKAAHEYIASQVEPARTIFAQHLEGTKARQIAHATGLSYRQVLKSLAKTYSVLMHI